MKTILNDNSKEIIFQKSSQMAVSTYCILWMLWACRTNQIPRGLIYWLPTDGDVSDFVKTKVDNLVDENLDELKGIRDKGTIDAYRQGLKFFWGTPTYWRGLKSKTGVKSISADASVFDEFDESDPAQVKQARERMSASEVKITRELSTPTIPDYGINKRFQESDQCYFAFKCPSCSRYNIMEQNFPRCLQQRLDGSYYRACSYCQKELDVSKGTWVRTNPSSELRGYQISQLYSPFIDPTLIMKEYHTTDFMGHFFNHKIGLPYLSASDRVTKEQVLSLCDSMKPMASNSVLPTVMGVDVGSKLHCVVLSTTKPHRMIWIGDVKDFEELDILMLKFNVRQLVIDALPETRKVRELIKRQNNKANACFYNDNLKGSYNWNEVENIVTVNRTESLDHGTDLILKSEMQLPQRSPLIEEFAQHCENIVKTSEEKKETGEKRFVYKKIGPDHYRHALNYALIAASRMKSGPAFSVFR